MRMSFPSTTCLNSSENKCSTDASKWMAVARREGNLKRNLGKTDKLHIKLYKSTFLKKPVLSLHESCEELTKMSCGKRQDREVGHSPDRPSPAASPCAGPPSGSSPSSPRRTLRSLLTPLLCLTNSHFSSRQRCKCHFKFGWRT